MVPLGAVLKVQEDSGPLVITRYNMYPAAAVNGNVSPGTSTGDGIALVEKLAEKEFPGRMAYEWTELTFLEKQSRAHWRTGFHSVGRVRLPRARGALRKLGVSVRGHAGGAGLRGLFVGGGLDHRSELGSAIALALERLAECAGMAQAERLGLEAGTLDRHRA